MEELIKTAFESGNATAILAAAVVYLIVYVQRKNTAASRDTAADELREKQNELEREYMLMKKDVDNLTTETVGIKEDIKEMKATLNQMAISLTKIAAKYEYDADKEKSKK